MSYVLKNLFLIFVLLISPKSIVTKAAASLNLEDLDLIGSGSEAGLKLAAQEIKKSGGFDPWVESKTGEIYKDKIDPAAPDTGQAITNVKNILGGILGAPLIDDAQAASDKIVDLQAIIDDGIDDIDSSLDPLQRTLPNAIQSVKTELGGTVGHTLLEDAQVVNDKIVDLQAIIDDGIDDIDSSLDPLQRTLPNAIQSVKTELGGKAGQTLLKDAQDAMLPTNSAKESIDPSKKTLSESITSILDKPENYDEMRQRAPLYLDGSDAKNPSIRSELIILLNILTQNGQNPIRRIDDTLAMKENVTLADIIVALAK